jgi:hypothetical protein
VAGNHHSGFQELDRPQGIRRSHGEVVADRKNGNIQIFFTDQLHIQK